MNKNIVTARELMHKELIRLDKLYQEAMDKISEKEYQDLLTKQYFNYLKWIPDIDVGDICSVIDIWSDISPLVKKDLPDGDIYICYNEIVPMTSWLKFEAQVLDKKIVKDYSMIDIVKNSKLREVEIKIKDIAIVHADVQRSY